MNKEAFFRFLLLSLASICFLVVRGQDRTQKVDLRPLLYKNFLKADILKKDGTTIEVSVNYNTDNQSLIFLTKDEYMELTGLDEISLIKINDEVFVPIDGKIYQKTKRNDLFISYSNKVVVNDIVSSNKGSELKSANESHNMVSDVYLSRNYSSPNNLAFVKNFWVMNGKDLVEVTNIKELSKAFHKSKKEINEFIKEYKIDFNTFSDIISLLNFVEAER